MAKSRITAGAADANETEGSSAPRSPLRLMYILEALATERDGLPPARLSEQLKLPKTRVFSLLRSLESGGYVRSENGRYRLGERTLRPGATLNHTQIFPNSMRPTLEWLAREMEEAILLAVPTEQGRETCCVGVIESEKPLRFTIWIGNRRPLYCTAPDKAILAFMPKGFQTKYLDRTKFVKFAPDTLAKGNRIERLALKAAMQISSLSDIAVLSRRRGECRSKVAAKAGSSA